MEWLGYDDDYIHNEGKLKTRADLMTAIVEGASERVRPIMMTVTSTVAGLLPIMWGVGTGSDVMQRIAAPMVGGMASAIITMRCGMAVA